MSSVLIRLMGAIILMATMCSADWWDDFSNNLAADLAPLLSLFGEQATKQFLSESTSILDNIIFALAPLGVITAVVSVIRVSGGPSLRAFIGRAQEGGGVVEAELCSSTSRDVCEMYHNGAIVRLFGRPKILEVIHDRNATDFYHFSDDSDTSKAACGIYPPGEYFGTPVGKAAGWIEGDRTSNPKNDNNNAGNTDSHEMKNADIEITAAEIENESTDEQKKSQFAPNPNLSLNIGFRKASRGVLWTVVGIGFIAQASVIIFAIFVTRYLQWEKEDAQPEPWGLPIMITGTLLLSLGMFSCAYLIERSTTERFFTRRSGSIKGHSKENDVSIYITQPGKQKIGDQTYDAFAYTNQHGELADYTTSWKPHDDNPTEDAKPHEKAWHAMGVWFATVTTMLGFILQFMGLRALHSAISVVLLGAIGLMSIIRAGLRTMRLKKDQNLFRHCPDQVVGHEMDWLAMRMGLEPPKPGPESDRSVFWSVVSPSTTQTNSSIIIKEEPQSNTSRAVDSRDGGRSSLMRRTATEGSRTIVCAFRILGTMPRALRTAESQWLAEIESEEHRLQPHLAGRLFYYRSRLAEITTRSTLGKSTSSTEWDYVPVRHQVQQLKKAIEASAEVLFEYGKFKPVQNEASPFNRSTESSNAWKTAHSFAWSIDVMVPCQGSPTPTSKSPKQIHIFLRKSTLANGSPSSKWEVDERSLEAVLGLWAWSMISDPMTQRKDDFGLTQSAACEVPIGRILAIGESVEDIQIARKEFEHWVDEVPALIPETKLPVELQDADLGAYSLWKSKVQDSLELERVLPTSDQPCDLRRMRRMFGWPGMTIPSAMSGSHTPCDKFVLMAEVKHSIPTLCAQDVYQSFLSAIASVLDSLEGSTSLVEASHGFYLTNDTVSKLLDLIEGSGLGSREDAKLIVIPTLRSRSKLPSPSVALPEAYRKADEHRHKRRFKAAENVLRWAYKIGQDAGYRDRNALTVEATILELAELYRYAHRAEELPRETNPPRDFYRNGLLWLEKVRDSLNSAPTTELINRYVELDKPQSPPRYDRRFVTDSEIALMSAKNGNRVHCLWILTTLGFNRDEDIDEPVKAAEKPERSTLSWAAQRGWTEVVKACLELKCEVDYPDEKGWTPLIYAANHGHVDIVRMLMLHGANPARKDGNQQPTLSHAAANGFASVVKALLQDESVDVSVKNQGGRTPLHHAAACGSCDTIDVLCQKGAQINECTARGTSAFVIAWEHGQSEAARHLRDLGAKFDFSDRGLELWWELFWQGQLKSVVDSIQMLNKENGKTSVGEEVKALLLFHEMGYALDTFPTDGIPVWNLAPGLEAVEITKGGITTPSHGTLVRYLRDEIEPTLKVFGFNEEPLTIPPRAQDCFNFTMDFMSYMKIEITEEIIGAAAKSGSRGSEDLFSYLLEQSRSKIPITADLVRSVVGAESETFVMRKVQRLVESHRNEVPITTEVLEEATRSGGARATCIMELLLEIEGTEKHVSTKVLQVMATRHPYSKKLIPKLCWRGLKENVVSDDVLKAMLYGLDGEWDDSDENVFKMLLKRRQGKVDVKEFEVIAKEGEGGKKALEWIHAHNEGKIIGELFDNSMT